MRLKPTEYQLLAIIAGGMNKSANPTYPRDQQRLLDALDADEFVLLTLDRSDLQGIRDIIDKYHDQEVDLADAALVQLADREGINVVFTIDRRHFGVYRKRDGSSFRLLPDPENL